MRRVLCTGVVLVAAALLSGTAGLACGDHLLRIGRGVRFQRAYAMRHANLVIYSSSAQTGATLPGARLQATLKQAGHKVQIAGGAAQLEQALKSGKVDVVLADFADLAGITRQLQSAPSSPVVLPFLFKPTKTEFAAAQKQYKFALKAPVDEIQFLTAIDEAMKSRLGTAAKS